MQSLSTAANPQAGPGSGPGPVVFYQFLGVHSLLIGLLPFFLPVYLWQHGLDLGGLTLLIGISGLSFVCALGLWQWLSSHRSLSWLINLSFALELLLVVSAGLCTLVPGSPLFQYPGTTLSVNSAGMVSAAIAIGTVNGLYNAVFWTTQRTLFLQLLGSQGAGRQYGNFQIFVTLFLKVGILLGGLLLDLGGFVWLLALSAGAGMASSCYLASQLEQPLIQSKTMSNKLGSDRAGSDSNARVTLAQSLRYDDEWHSRPVFIVDGLFLYLESHFWTLTLFLVVREDYGRLGLAVVTLAVIFAILFYLIKNRIDRLEVERVYQAGVILYVASWILRFTLGADAHGASLWAALITIAFCSSFFRLTFNKRFFDLAR